MTTYVNVGKDIDKAVELINLTDDKFIDVFKQRGQELMDEDVDIVIEINSDGATQWDTYDSFVSTFNIYPNEIITYEEYKKRVIMADKKVYAWAYKDFSGNFQVNTLKPIDNLDNVEPLYSIEEVQYVIENNELPKRPVAWVYSDNISESKLVVTNKPINLDYKPVYSADELLAELQKEI